MSNILIFNHSEIIERNQYKKSKLHEKIRRKSWFFGPTVCRYKSNLNLNKKLIKKDSTKKTNGICNKQQ